MKKITLLIGYGLGKSSVAQKLILENDYKLICDSYIVLDSKRIINCNPLCLWENIALKYNYKIENLKPVRKEIFKYYIDNPICKTSEKEQIYSILIFEPYFKNKFEQVEIKNLKKAEEVFNCIKSFDLYQNLAFIKRDFAKLIDITNKAKVIKIFNAKKNLEIENINNIFEIVKN